MMDTIEAKFEIGEMKSVEEAVEMAKHGLDTLRSRGSWAMKLTFSPNVIDDENGWVWDVLVEATWMPPRQTGDELGEMVLSTPAKIAQQWLDRREVSDE